MDMKRAGEGDQIRTRDLGPLRLLALGSCPMDAGRGQVNKKDVSGEAWVAQRISACLQSRA